MLTEEMLNAKNLGIIKNSGSIVLDMPDGPVGMAYFKFTVEEGCLLNFSADSLSLSFYDADGNHIMLNGYGSYTYEFTPGDYYITPMGGSTSDITLNITYAEAIVGNNSVETAYEWGTISGEKTFENIYIAGSMGGMPGGGTSLSSEYYSFTLAEDSVITISTPSSGAMAPSGPAMTIIDSEGNRYSVASSMGAAMGPSPLELKSGTYTLEIGVPYGSFAGDIVISQEKGIAGNDTPETAYNLGTVSGEKTVENIYITGTTPVPGASASSDYYKFTLAEDSLITISTPSSGAMAPMGPTMTIIDSEGNSYSAGGSPGMMGPAFLELKSGTYTLAISISSGTYSGDITISQSKNIIGNDTVETAYDWGTISGEKTFENIYIAGSMGGMPGDGTSLASEYYSFTLADVCLISVYATPEGTDPAMTMPPAMRLIDSEGNYCSVTYLGMNGLEAELKSGTYTLEINSTYSSFFGDITISQAKAIVGNDTVETAYDWGTISGEKTFEDIYVAPPDGIGEMSSVEFYSFSIKRAAEVSINTVDKAGSVVWSSRSLYKETANGYEEVLDFSSSGITLEAGKYVLGITSPGGVGSFDVKINAAVTAPEQIYISSLYQYPFYVPSHLTIGEDAFASISEADEAGVLNDNDVIMTDGYIVVNNDDFAKIQNVNNVFASYDGKDHTPAAGYIVFNDIDTEKGSLPSFQNFLTVSVNNSELNSTFDKNHYYFEYPIGETTYCYYSGNGSFTANDSAVGAVNNYQTVIFTNTNSGNIINDSLASIVSGYDLVRTSTASGYLSVTANMNGEEDEYSIGTNKSFDYSKFAGSVNYSEVAISGYATAMISGFQHWADDDIEKDIVINGHILGGNSTDNGSSPEYTAAGYLSLNNEVTVNGHILYFATVTGSNDIDIFGDIYKGDDTVINYQSGFYDSSWMWNTTDVSLIIKSGTVSLTDAYVKDITNYQTVILTDTNSGNIINKTLAQKEIIDNTTIIKNLAFNSTGYLSISATDDDEYFIGNINNGKTADITVDKNGNEFTDGNAIYGYGTVMVSGYRDWLNSSNNKKITVSGTITGGNRSYQNETYGGDDKIHETSAGMASLTLADITGDVKGFSTVVLSDATVNGKIDNLDNSSYSYSYSRYIYNSSGGYFENVSVTNYISSGYINASNSDIKGDIENYLTVYLTNTSAGNISRDIFSGQSIYPDEIEDTYSSAGNVSISLNYSADKNKIYKVGDIEGYTTVTINGYIDYTNPDNNIEITTGAITSGNKVAKYYKVIRPEQATKIDSAVGYISVNTAKTEDIYGFNAVNLNSADINGDVIAAYTPVSRGDKDKIYCGSIYSSGLDSYYAPIYIAVSSAASFTMSNSSVEGAVRGYGYVSLNNSTAAAIDMGTAYTVNHSYSYSYMNDLTIASYTHTANKYNSVIITDSEVKAGEEYGTVNNFGYVTITNSNVGNITMDLLTSINGSCYGSYNSGTITTEYSAQGSVTVSAAWNAENDYRTGAISGYQNVTISGGNGHKVVVNGNITGGAYTITEAWKVSSGYDGIYTPKAEEPTSAQSTGSVTLNAGAVVTGDVYGYNIVTVNSAVVKGAIISYENTSGLMASFTAAEIKGVGGYQIVNFYGINQADAIYGNSKAAANITVNYGATVTAKEVVLDSDDTLNISGTLVMTGSTFEAANVGGYGEIVALKDVYNTIKDNFSSSTVKMVNLGQTAENFVSTTAEHADDYSYAPTYWADAANKESLIQPVSESSFIADSELDILQTRSVEYNATEAAYYNGYLSGNFDGSCQDLVDYVMFCADKDGLLQLSCTTDGVADNTISLVDGQGNAITNNYEVVQGTYYTIGIKLNEEYNDSVSYKLAYLA